MNSGSPDLPVQMPDQVLIAPDNEGYQENVFSCFSIKTCCKVLLMSNHIIHFPGDLLDCVEVLWPSQPNVLFFLFL